MTPDYRPQIVTAYNRFNGKNLDVLDDFYADDISFIDPITSLKSLAELKRYYTHAYANVRSIRFDFDEISRDGQRYFAPWTMTFSAARLNGGKEFSVSGLSHLEFNSAGLVCYHRDYLDLGEMVYSRLPVLGLVIAQVKKLLK
jgi:SnoaL-like domain